MAERSVARASLRPGTRLVFLLGRRDRPTDGVGDYCRYLADALERRSHRLVTLRVAWAEGGWVSALVKLWRRSRHWTGRWVLSHYTALGWSRRGFPVRFLAVLAVLRLRRCRIGVVFHDATAYPGRRIVDRVRRGVQHVVMRLAYRVAERAVLNVPVETVRWLPERSFKATHIPVGANLPIPTAQSRCQEGSDSVRTVAVFGVTGGAAAEEQVRDIGFAATRAARALGGLRLVVLGRGAQDAEGLLRQVLEEPAIELSVSGVLPPEEVSRTLVRADVLLFVRGPLSSQRGSAIAGLACGLPVVGYSGPHTGPPLTEAGVALAPYRDREALADRLVEVLRDPTLRERLRAMTVEAYRRHFSWDAIAERYTEVLGA